MKHIKGLDTLRAYSIFIVVLAHWNLPYKGDYLAIKFLLTFLAPDGGFGVHIFFVLSGFLITSILLNARNNERTNKFLILKNFIFRRALRIFPIYYLMISFLFLINYEDVRANITYALTYTMNILCYRTNSWNSISHTWTLCVEEQFYLVWPWLILFVKDKYFTYIYFALIATGIITTWYIYSIQRMPFLLFNYSDAFGMGAFYAYVRQHPDKRALFERVIKWLFVIVLLIYIRWQWIAYNQQWVRYGYFLRKTFDSIMGIWLIMMIVNNKSAFTKKYILENRFFNFIGKISYGIYLYHVPFVPLVATPIKNLVDKWSLRYPGNPLFSNYTLYYCFVLALLIGFSWLSYALIEKPLLGIKRFFQYTKPGLPAQPVVNSDPL